MATRLEAVSLGQMLDVLAQVFPFRRRPIQRLSAYHHYVPGELIALLIHVSDLENRQFVALGTPPVALAKQASKARHPEHQGVPHRSVPRAYLVLIAAVKESSQMEISDSVLLDLSKVALV